jgi:hypothetical protein
MTWNVLLALKWGNFFLLKVNNKIANFAKISKQGIKFRDKMLLKKFLLKMCIFQWATSWEIGVRLLFTIDCTVVDKYAYISLNYAVK